MITKEKSSVTIKIAEEETDAEGPQATPAAGSQRVVSNFAAAFRAATARMKARAEANQDHIRSERAQREKEAEEIRTQEARDIEVIQKLVEHLYKVADGSPRMAYGLALALRDTIYRRLTAADTAATHFFSLLLAALVEGLLTSFIIVNAGDGIQTIRGAHNLLIGAVHAQTRGSVANGLPQWTVDGLLCLAALVFAIVILGLLWSGFLAKSKSAKAQAILQHVITAVTSIATGVILARGGP